MLKKRSTVINLDSDSDPEPDVKKAACLDSDENVANFNDYLKFESSVEMYI